MAKRRKRSARTNRRTRRKTTTIKKNNLINTPKRSRLRSAIPYPRKQRKTTVRPSNRKVRVLPALTVVKRQSKTLQRKHLTIKNLTPSEIPTKLHCVKRAMRKEVMHALKKTGQAGQKKAKWTKESKLKC
jgi:hypothetical protein